MPNFTFCEGSTQTSNGKIFFLFMNLDMVDRNSVPEGKSLAFDKVSELNYDEDRKNVNSLFK